MGWQRQIKAAVRPGAWKGMGVGEGNSPRALEEGHLGDSQRVLGSCCRLGLEHPTVACMLGRRREGQLTGTMGLW